MPRYGERDSLTAELKDIQRRLRAIETSSGADGSGSGGTGSVGPTGPPGPTAVSTNAGNYAGLGSDSLIYVQHPAVFDVNVRFSSYTLASSDVGLLIPMVDTAAMTLTIPTDASVAWPTGGHATIMVGSTGVVTVAAASPGTTAVNSKGGSLVSDGQWSMIHVLKRSVNAWVVWGDLA